MTASHRLYTTADKDRPKVICDQNGEVVLGLCKVCGQAEADLEPTCPGPRTLPPEQQGAHTGGHWRVRTNRHTATSGEEWGWVSEASNDSRSVGGLRIEWQGAAQRLTAQKIAASPALLAALKDAIGALEFSRDYHNDLGNEEQAFVQDKLDAAVAAISLAEGKS